MLTTHSNNFDDILRAIVRIDHRSMTLEFEAPKSHFYLEFTETEAIKASILPRVAEEKDYWDLST